MRDRQEERRSWSWLMITLAAVAPFTADMARNFPLFSGRQLVLSLAAIVVATTIVTVAALLLAKGARTRLTGTRIDPKRVDRAIVAVAAAGVFATFMLDSNLTELRQELHLSRALTGAILVSLFLVYWALAAGLGSRLTAALLAIAMAFSIATAGLAVTRSTRQGNTLGSKRITADYERVRLARTPNIYFIMLESYHGPTAMRELYGIDNSRFTQFLESNGFTINEPTYSNYHYTMASLESIFRMEHHYLRGAFGNYDSISGRSVVSGGRPHENPVLEILKHSGYSIVYLLPSDYYYAPGAGLVDVALIERSRWFAPLKASLPRFLGRETDTRVREYPRRLREAIVRWPADKPAFFFAILGANHTQLGYDYRADRPAFVRYYTSADQPRSDANPECRSVYFQRQCICCETSGNTRQTGAEDFVR